MAPTVDTQTLRVFCASKCHISAKKQKKCKIHQQTIFPSPWQANITLLRASTWLISSRFCCDILWPSSSDIQPSQDRHALSNTCWIEVDSLTWDEKNKWINSHVKLCTRPKQMRFVFLHPTPIETQTKQQMQTAAYQIALCLIHRIY